MKLMNNAVFGLIAGLIGATQVATAITADNPYTGSITNRNLFNLKPAPDPVATAPAPPPPNIPNIKLAGITTIMGGRRAILRVPRAARPPQPAAEVSLMLQEGGPTEEGVKVLEINIAAGSVKIDNNGTVQTLDLENDAPKSAPAPAPAVAPGGIPVPGQNPAGAIPVPMSVNPAGGGITSMSREIRGAGPAGMVENQPGAVAQTPEVAAGGWSGRRFGVGGMPAQSMSPEDQQIMIEAQRVADPVQAPILPPTALGDILNEEAAGGGGNPSPL